jgi:hypothetical protein
VGLLGPGPTAWRLLSPAQAVRRRAIRGAFGGQRAWLIVVGIIWGGGTLRRVFGRQTESLMLPKLAPGQSATISVIRPTTRRQRRAARRAG